MDGEDDVANAGHISGGDEANGATGDGNVFGGDKEDNYGYYNCDDSNDENSEPKLDLTDDALGLEDGEGDEM